jgi:hypothetical protein
MTKETARSVEQVLREFPPVGKYRVRLVRGGQTAVKALDIREYVTGKEFEGFTRRGIRLTSRADLDLLRDVLKEVLENTLL